VLVADLLVRLDVVVVEQLKARHRASLPPRPVIDTNRIGRITNGHIQNIRDPSLVRQRGPTVCWSEHHTHQS
jgi:hypothetical protein